MSFITDLLTGGIQGIGDAAKTVISAFKADPTKVIEIEQAERELDKKIEETKLTLSTQLEQAYLKDIEDARNREIQIANSDKAPWLNKTILPILAGGVTIGFFGLLTYMLKYTIPPENKDVLNIMLGSLGMAWSMIIGYYFGSSMSSATKDKTINTIINK